MIIPFFTTVDSILDDFTTKVRDLTNLAGRYTVQAQDAEDEAAGLRARADEFRIEAKRAANIADKINKLVS